MQAADQIISDTSCVIYTDGACSGNPGPRGWGSIVYLLPQIAKSGKVIELGDRNGSTTNNRMELTAVIEALKLVRNTVSESEQNGLSGTPKQLRKVFIFTDSVYVIRGITQWIFGWMRQGWKNQEGQAIANQEHWIELNDVVRSLKGLGYTLNWEYVRGHNGDLGNERCDQIAVAFSQGQYTELFHGSADAYRFDLMKWPKSEPLPEMKPRTSSASPQKSWYIAAFGTQVMKFETWYSCEAAVKGRSGVKFKKVSSAEEEAQVLSQWGIQSK